MPRRCRRCAVLGPLNQHAHVACTSQTIHRASSLLLAVTCRRCLECECHQVQKRRLHVITVQLLMPSPRWPPTDYFATLSILYYRAGCFVPRRNPLTGIGMALQLACQSCAHMHRQCMWLRRHATHPPSTIVHMRRRCRISWNRWTETISGRCRRSPTAAVRLHATRPATKPSSRAGPPGITACIPRQSRASNQPYGPTVSRDVLASGIQSARGCYADAWHGPGCCAFGRQPQLHLWYATDRNASEPTSSRLRAHSPARSLHITLTASQF